MALPPHGTRSPAVLLLALALGVAALARPLAAQDGYHDAAALRSAFDRLAGAHGGLVEVTELARSPGGRPVFAVRLGRGDDVNERPALLIIANAEGTHVAGSELTLAVATRLAEGAATDTAIGGLLDRTTLYVIPRANPDAAEAMFGRPLMERTRNGTAMDDDHDQAADEDGPEDLNGDGLITMMRVEDPAGEWMADSADPVLMRKADPAKGEAGRYRVMVEGTDTDRDEQWNEDPAGGVDINRNFSYGYKFFGEAAGRYPFDAPEARAVAQFFVDHPNVTEVYVLGPQDNLLKAWEHKKAGGESQGGGRSRRPLTSVTEEDAPWFAEMARRYRDATGREKGPASAALTGDPLSWSYYHMGRWAFGAPAWWPPAVKAEAADSGEAKPKAARGGAGAGAGEKKDDPLADDRQALAWLRANRPDGIVEWTPVQHRDFPDRKVEVGGFRPFVRSNPPATVLDSLASGQVAFVRSMLEALPRAEVRNVRIEALGGRVFRVTAEIANAGYLPTQSDLGGMVRWPRRIRVELQTGADQSITGGRAIQLLDPIPGSGRSRELTWVVVGDPGSRVTLHASSPVAGMASYPLTLRADRGNR